VKEVGKRAARVAEDLRHELAAAVRALRDPRVAGVLVSRVEIDAALQRARVYVRHELGLDEPGARRELLRGLESAAGRLRREVARRMTLRSVPALEFLYDEGPDEQRRIEQILREIQQDEASRGHGDRGGG
jgi:ribosome-binding factor A